MTSHPLYRGRDSTTCCPSRVDSFQVTGDGHGSQPLGCQPFSLQPPASGCQLLWPSCPPAPVPSAPPLVNVSTCQHVPSRLRRAHLCTGAPLRFAPLHVIFASLRPSCPPALVSSSYTPSQLSGSPMVPPLSSASSPCQHVNLSTGQLVIRSSPSSSPRVLRTLRPFPHHTPRSTSLSPAWRQYCR